MLMAERSFILNEHQVIESGILLSLTKLYLLVSLFEWITNFLHSFCQGGISMQFCHLVWTGKLNAVSVNKGYLKYFEDYS